MAIRVSRLATELAYYFLAVFNCFSFEFSISTIYKLSRGE